MKRILEMIDWLLVVVSAVFLILFYFDQSWVSNDALAVLAIASTLPVLVSAVKAGIRGKISIDLLATLALIISLIAKEWSSAVFINLMLASARIFSSYTEGRASQAIKSLLKLRPQKVKVREGDTITEKSIDQVKIGDLVMIEAGERIAVDGTIESGEASINQASLTGESAAIIKTKGELIYSGTLNESGSITVRTTKVGVDTALAKIIKLVEASQNSKASIHTLGDSFTAWYIFLAVTIAVLVYAYTQDLDFILALLLVACADDIAVAIPLAFYAAISNAARQGIIIKGGNYLEGLTKVKTFLMDKTGTLTQGTLRVAEVVPFGTYSVADVIKYGAAVEYFSDHSAAKAITQYANEQKVDYPKSKDCGEIPGKGSSVSIEGEKYLGGKLAYLLESGVVVSEHQTHDIKAAKERGLNTTIISHNKELIGFIGLADELRPGIKEDIAELRDLGVKKFVILTGDNEIVADRIAHEVGISEFHANLLPEDKITYIKAEINNKDKVAMVGDGVNDAAALALADVSISMGVIGSDATIEASDIALMHDDFSKIPAAIRLGKETMRVTHEDFAIWGIVNAVGFFFVLMHVIGVQGAAAYNFFTDFLPFFNSLRLLRMTKF